MGKCTVALITLAGRPRSEGRKGTNLRMMTQDLPQAPFEQPYGLMTVNAYAMAAMRHMLRSARWMPGQMRRPQPKV